MISLPWKILISALALVISGCIYTPKTITYYNDECSLHSKKMELDAHQMQAIEICSNENCLGSALGAGAISAASIVVSGTVVVVGNMVYWFERSGQCKKRQA